MRIFSVLLWILFPGCWAVAPVTGPGAVSGPQGGSVAVRCGYRNGYEDYQKFWCRAERMFCSNDSIFVNLRSEAEVKRGRVSIRDNHTLSTFTVTLENLTLADAGTYHCGVGSSGHLIDTVNITVFSAVPTSPLRTPEKDLTVATSPWTVPAGIPNLVLYILIPSVLLVLLLILFIAVKFRRASQRRSKGENSLINFATLEDTAGQKEKNVSLYTTIPGHNLPFSASDPAATGQMTIYMNVQHLPSSADPASVYERMIPQMSQVSGQRKAVSSGPQDCPATDQQDTYITMCAITPHSPMICHQAKCGRKAAG
ncbi:CMRF35-like molecule 5 isoform X1 [Chrysemys picta bellii]|uniref:CMRF35-like molecule 5 isoform X1 n=1 Tax=Chrysemys picta bellii TaxID=8478 RepID=UPI0032B1F5B5